jgi:hypothetical protein
MRKISAMVSRLDPKELADLGFQDLPFHWQKYFEQDPKLRQRLELSLD